MIVIDCRLFVTMGMRMEDLKLLQNKKEQLKNDFDQCSSDFLVKWRNDLVHMRVTDAMQNWLSNLREGTRKNYSYYMYDLIDRKLILLIDLSEFNKINHEAVLDNIKRIDEWSEGTRQLKAACYISFTAYLNRMTQGWFRRVYPSKLSANPTFYQTRDKCTTDALKLNEWHRFISALDRTNRRDSLIARCMLQGAKRVSEALELTLDQINFEKNIIYYFQKKTGGMLKEIPISYPEHFMSEVKSYIHDTEKHRVNSKYVFITRNGKQLNRTRMNYSFAVASKEANIKKVTPHMLRATWVTLAKEQGVQDTEIMKVTGHTSSKMIYAYDKTSAEENYTKKLTLI